MDEADRHRLVGLLTDSSDQGAGAVLVEGHEHLASRVQALGHHVSIGSLDERRRQHDVEVVLLEARLRSRLDHVTETVGRDQCRLRPSTFDQRVGGECRAMDDLLDVAQVDAFLCGDLGNTVENAELRRLVGGEDLRRGIDGSGGALGVELHDDVGERAADVGADANTHVQTSVIRLATAARACSLRR